MSLLIGVDFGTEAVRAVLINSEHGELVARSARSYTNGVIDAVLPGAGLSLGEDWALQDPADWLLGFEEVVKDVVRHSGASPDSVSGIGIDFTSCTILPVDADHIPLCQHKSLSGEPHAWPKLWKHHAAQPQADRINRMAASSGESWLARYGGKISSEWMMPKALEILEEAPSIYADADALAEGADWIVWSLTGRMVRNSCSAGFKAQWHHADGYPGREFLESLNQQLGDLFEKKLRGEIVAPGRFAGTLTPAWAARLGLDEGTVVATGIIDAHAAAIGGGSAHAGDMFIIMGTSTCHLLLSDREVAVDGISGVVDGGIVEGLFGYEAGQAATGDTLAWFTSSAVTDEYRLKARAGVSIHDILSEMAAESEPGESGLLALDWLNGNRSVLVDADLTGAIIGLTLSTRPEEIYRALIESTAFGTRKIIETFDGSGLDVRHIRVGGSLAGNDLLMKIYADILKRDLLVVEATEVSARGAAILAGVASGEFRTAAEGADRVGTRFAKTYSPNQARAETYDRLYAEWESIHDYFGRSDTHIMKTLKDLRRK